MVHLSYRHACVSVIGMLEIHARVSVSGTLKIHTQYSECGVTLSILAHSGAHKLPEEPRLQVALRRILITHHAIQKTCDA